MKLYHGNTLIIKHPDTSHSKQHLDFGPGFYLTSYKEQAAKWARRKGLRTNATPVLNVYEMSEDWSLFRTLLFEKADVPWLDYVCACRRGESLFTQYDIVQGSVANDDVFKTVDLYMRGIWDKEKTLSELRFSAPNNQIALLSQPAINALLSFEEAHQLEM